MTFHTVISFGTIFLTSHTFVSGWLVRKMKTLVIFYINGIALMFSCLNDYYLGFLHLTKMMDQSHSLQMQSCKPELNRA